MRITKAHKEKIVNALTKDVAKTCKEKVTVLRQEAYDKAKASLPTTIQAAYANHREFFHSTTRAQARNTYQYVSFPNGMSLPHPARHLDIPAIAGDIKHLKDDHRALRRKVEAALSPFTTFKKLKDGWPEAAAILPDPKKAITALVDLDHVDKIREMLKQGAID